MRVLLAKSPGYEDQSYVFPFAKSLLTYFERAGVSWTSEPETGEDVAVCVQWDPPLEVVRSLRRRGVVVVHRLDGRARSVVKVYERDEENRQINGAADWTVFQSRYVREHTSGSCETIFGLEAPICAAPERGSIIYNGVDRRIFREDGPRETLEGEFNILHVAFTHGIRKGVGDLVRAAELLRSNPKIRFYTVGRQDLDVAHGHLLSRLPNVTHLGVIVDRERMAGLMRSCDVLFFPSRDDYCPNTVLEAMSCGLPVWYHNSGGTPELVRTEELVAGVPMMPENPIYPLYVLREHRGEFSRRAVEMVRRRFTLEHMGDAYVELFAKLLRDRDRDGGAAGRGSRAAHAQAAGPV
jgi:glycosyltransferase involved in cell wall biosynthesis